MHIDNQLFSNLFTWVLRLFVSGVDRLAKFVKLFYTVPMTDVKPLFSAAPINRDTASSFAMPASLYQIQSRARYDLAQWVIQVLLTVVAVCVVMSSSGFWASDLVAGAWLSILIAPAAYPMSWLIVRILAKFRTI